MSRTLVIVESPAKAKTIGKYLGPDFVVESSVGHIRDLAVPKQLPKEKRKENEYIDGYAVDVENGFEPIYVVTERKRSTVAELRKTLKESDELLLATDEDREGESIAWHLVEVLKPKVPVKRMVFHEITKKAILEAVQNPRTIDQNLVDAQEARRILDRLYGFAMSKVTWRRTRGRSAGRVQSVATRIVVERERERMAHVRASYWSASGSFDANGTFGGSLLEIDGKRVASGKDFGDDGKLKKPGLTHLDEATASALVAKLPQASFVVSQVQKKPTTRRPSPPFMTSTLQQEAGRKLGWSASQTMRVAQSLYENGFITYMRTDSTTLSQTALDAARKQIAELYGKDEVPAKPRQYNRSVKNAQEAHEAIRPAGDEFQKPEDIQRQLGKNEARLYELIWKRTVASQMKDAKGEQVSVRIEGTLADGQKVMFASSGLTWTAPGFFKAYVEGSDDPEAELESKERTLPPLTEGQALTGKEFEAKGHETQPPARYTEASLVKRLEELGVGRPSTYASIISVIQDRGYVWRRGKALVPSFTAFVVVRLLEEHFKDLVDYQFTARMEDDLDRIAAGDADRNAYLRDFFFGTDAREGLEVRVKQKLEKDGDLGPEEMQRLETTPIGKDEQGRDIVVRVGKFGAFLQAGSKEDGQTCSLPDDLAPDEVTVEKALELLAMPSGDRVIGEDPDTGLPVIVRNGRFGSYVQLGEGGKDKEKPATASLFKTMDPETVTLPEALRLLSLPRVVGVAEDGEEILARNGRYGPYITKGKETRNLETEEAIFTVTLEQALELLKQPKKRRGAKAAAPPLKELGEDPVSGGKIVLKEGRWGPYVTDGETNASLRRGDTVENITPERAHELLALRREKVASAPKKKKAAKKKPAKKKTTKKKTTKKKAAKKKTTKKAAKKKTTKKAAKKTTKKAAKKTTKKAAKKSADA